MYYLFFRISTKTCLSRRKAKCVLSRSPLVHMEVRCIASTRMSTSVFDSKSCVVTRMPLLHKDASYLSENSREGEHHFVASDRGHPTLPSFDLPK
jgi:hypothetical protein